MSNTYNEVIPRFTQRYIFLISCITSVLGILLIIFPGIIGKLLFNDFESSLNFFIRMLGSTLFGYGVLCFLTFKSKSIVGFKIAVWSNLSTLFIATLLSILYIDTYTGYNWLVIGQHVLFTMGFVYCAWQLHST
jgi:hypothetical protein